MFTKLYLILFLFKTEGKSYLIAREQQKFTNFSSETSRFFHFKSTFNIWASSRSWLLLDFNSFHLSLVSQSLIDLLEDQCDWWRVQLCLSYHFLLGADPTRLILWWWVDQALLPQGVHKYYLHALIKWKDFVLICLGFKFYIHNNVPEDLF